MFYNDYKGKCVYCKENISREEEAVIRHDNISKVLRSMLTEEISCRKKECTK